MDFSRRRRLGRGRGFSLIELLIVVAIIAALVGVAVPFFQDNLTESQRAKAGQDLEVLRKAVALYEQREGRLLTGTSLAPLLGRYLADIPKDPWGNPYLYEGAVGFLGTYGADALPGGDGADADLIRGGYEGGSSSVPVLPVFMRRAQYAGPWGPPRAPESPAAFNTGSKIIVTYTRPLSEPQPGLTPQDFLMGNVDGGGVYHASPLTDPTSWLPDTWQSAAAPAFGVRVDPLHRPELGVMVLRANTENYGNPTSTPVRPASRVSQRHVDDDYPAVSAGTPLSLATTYSAGADPASPLDPAVYGAAVSAFDTAVLPPPDEGPGSALPGIALERY